MRPVRAGRQAFRINSRFFCIQSGSRARSSITATGRPTPQGFDFAHHLRGRLGERRDRVVRPQEGSDVLPLPVLRLEFHRGHVIHRVLGVEGRQLHGSNSTTRCNRQPFRAAKAPSAGPRDRTRIHAARRIRTSSCCGWADAGATQPTPRVPRGILISRSTSPLQARCFTADVLTHPKSRNLSPGSMAAYRRNRDPPARKPRKTVMSDPATADLRARSRALCCVACAATRPRSSPVSRSQGLTWLLHPEV